MFNEVTILAQNSPLPPKKQIGKHINERSPQKGVGNKILSRHIQTMSLVGVVFVWVKIGRCEDMSIQYFITKAIKRCWVGNVGQFYLILHHIITRLYH